MNEVKQTFNRGTIIGVLSEKKLDMEVGKEKIKLKDGNLVDNHIIKGSIVVCCNNHDYEINIFQSEYTKNGDTSRNFTNFKALMDEYISKADAALNRSLVPDTIEVTCNLSCNDFYSVKNNKMSSSLRVRSNAFNRRNADTPHMIEFVLEGIIRSIKPEVKFSSNNDEEPEETGRLLVEFYTINYNSEAEPFTIIVPEEFADDFVNNYNPGTTTSLYVELSTRSVGGNSNKRKAAFGRTANITEGFEVIETVLFGGDEPYDEETLDKDGKCKMILPEDMKLLLKEREIKLQQIEKDTKDRDSNGNTSSSSSKKGLGNRKPKVDTSSIPDEPF